MRLLGTLLVLFSLGCHKLPTQPACEEEQYGIIKFVNLTDEFKQVYVFRVIHDGDSYKRVGEPYQRLIEPMVEGRLHVHPGMVLVIVDRINGKRWGKILTLGPCEVVVVQTKAPVVLKDLEIKPRRSGGL